MRVYVASSWRNPLFDGVITKMKAAGLDCYDFRRDSAFHWDEVGLMSTSDVTLTQYRRAMRAKRAKRGLMSDWDALRDADACVLVQPAGASSHLELGHAIGAGLMTAVLIADPDHVNPELMYGMVDLVTDNLADIVKFLLTP